VKANHFFLTAIGSLNPEELRKRTKSFAISIIKFSPKLRNSEETLVIKRHILRSGTVSAQITGQRAGQDQKGSSFQS
jgi:hypothetical protein